MSCSCSAKRCDVVVGGTSDARPRYVEVGGAAAGDVGGRVACGAGRVSVHVRLLWTLLSVTVTVGCTYSFIQPSWYVHGVTGDRLGLFNYCVTDARSSPTDAAVASHRSPPKTLWSLRYSYIYLLTTLYCS